jgi:hypothetical protein
MSFTSDREDPRLTHGSDSGPVPQAPVYLVLSEDERAKGFIRPLRRAYVHRDGCGTRTTMALALCETYARQPTFYGSTYCAGCSMHRPVGEFRWDEDGAVVGA